MKYNSCKYPSKKQNICINYITWYKKIKYHRRDGWKWINALCVLSNKIISLYKPVAAVIHATVAAVSARRDRSGKTRWADWSIPFTSLVGGSGGGVWSSPEHGKRSFARVRKSVAPLLFHVIISARLSPLGLTVLTVRDIANFPLANYMYGGTLHPPHLSSKPFRYVQLFSIYLLLSILPASNLCTQAHTHVSPIVSETNNKFVMINIMNNQIFCTCLNFIVGSFIGP